MTKAARAQALSDLIACRLPLARALERLQVFSWDLDQPLVRIAISDVVEVLRRYRAGELTAHEVETWANALEQRDDVDCAEDVGQLLFELATPEINDPLTPALADALVRRYDSPSN